MMAALTLAMVIEVCVKATAVLLLATFAAVALRRSSAALRHRIWAVALTGLVLLPLLANVLPAWNLGIAQGSEVSNENVLTTRTTVVTGDANVATAARSSDGVGTLMWLLVAWLVGAALVASWLVAGVWGARRLRRDSFDRERDGLLEALERAHRRLGIENPVPVAFTDSLRVPVLLGILRPVILLPSAAVSWSNTRLENVLVHELAHCERRDNLSNLVARIACCLFWFHPLVWFAAHRLRIEREHAADDAVLLTGTPASQYAEDLLSVARTAGPAGAFIGATLANRSPIGSRVASLLDSARCRHPVSRRTRWASAILAVATIFVVACAKPAAPIQSEHAKVATTTPPVATFDADGATIDLLAADVPRSVVRRQAFPMTLYWRARTPFPKNPAPKERWQVFVHFDGPLPLAPYGKGSKGYRFQADHFVNAPGSWWNDRTVVEDRFAVMAGHADFARGEYAVYVGWFKGGPGQWTNAVITEGKKAPEGYGINRHPLGTITLR